jgi:hypothetical protein
MANRGYDVVVDVDDEVYSLSVSVIPFTTPTNRFQGDLGHTDLQEDLEFHNSSTLPSATAQP